MISGATTCLTKPLVHIVAFHLLGHFPWRVKLSPSFLMVYFLPITFQLLPLLTDMLLASNVLRPRRHGWCEISQGVKV